VFSKFFADGLDCTSILGHHRVLIYQLNPWIRSMNLDWQSDCRYEFWLDRGCPCCNAAIPEKQKRMGEEYKRSNETQTETE
jgi:hypothetical protein